MTLSRQKFKDIDLSDPFFDSLKKDYEEFPTWFAKKAEDHAYVFYGDDDKSIEGFLYLKREDGPLTDVTPALPAAIRIKVGTMKINPHGTRLGERFLKKIFDHAITEGAKEVYVTVFEKHSALVALFERYGFVKASTKTTKNGTELVLVKEMLVDKGSTLERYPLVKLGTQAIYLLSIKPIWHTRLLPDSILKSEDASIVMDVSHTNSIHKVYLAGMRGMGRIQVGDVILIYRTTDNLGPARYRSVATSVAVVEESRHISTFPDINAFIRYCQPYSVFELDELKSLWETQDYPHVLRFTYNFALPKRITRGKMIDAMGFDPNEYWGLMRLSKKQLRDVLFAAGLDENLVID
ncbi:N-acetyltransferase [Azohydromonas lata]|uniref:N-acetyltransferase n=1 Tax=Azohydromonas lata TaxID=45677 RepID=A0ABU5IDT1_9BURK|nr:N-acetyltransferase [Azohydromonas lata]MDZ5456984.1 N-acetyltransferase [Azohydromonas lata]